MLFISVRPQDTAVTSAALLLLPLLLSAYPLSLVRTCPLPPAVFVVVMLVLACARTRAALVLEEPCVGEEGRHSWGDRKSCNACTCAMC